MFLMIRHVKNIEYGFQPAYLVVAVHLTTAYLELNNHAMLISKNDFFGKINANI